MYLLLCMVLGVTISYRGGVPKNDITFHHTKGYVIPRLADAVYDNPVGYPSLPSIPIFFYVPEDAKVTNCEFKVIHREIVGLDAPIYPTQPPVIKPIPGKEIPVPGFVHLKEEIKSLAAYPATYTRLGHIGNLSGYHVQEVIIYPVRYLPDKNALELVTEFELQLTYEGGKHSSGSILGYELASGIVANPSDLPAPKSSSPAYLVITSSSMIDEFAPLIEWKRQKGLHVITQNIQWIYSHYEGIDCAAKIRNYIRDMYEDSNVVFVLLGGDTNIIPKRIAFAMCCEAGFEPNEDSICADLYYSDLDGTWDADGDGVYGEVTDNVDLYPDVIVGRASVNYGAEAAIWVDKLLTYERNPPGDYENRALFLGEILWPDPYTDAGIGKDMIEEAAFPPAGWEITKLYESLGNEDPDAVMEEVNEGKNLINHDGHAWWYVMGVGTGYISNYEMDILINAPRYGIWYSIGCWPAAFDYDCIAEHFIHSPQGGGVAFIGNNRYGWGSPGNPGYGYSDVYDREFFVVLFKHSGYKHLGLALAEAKIHFIPYARDANVWRWHQYQINLLGDPEMPVWLGIPNDMEVSLPDQIPTGDVTLRVVVSADGWPLDSVRVAVAKPDESLYEHTYTDANGTAILNLHVETEGNLIVTVTKPNYKPVIDTIQTGDGYIPPQFYGYTIVDTLGNNNGEPNPGDTIVLVTELACVEGPYSGVLSTNDTYITVIDSIDGRDSCLQDTAVLRFTLYIDDESPPHSAGLGLRFNFDYCVCNYNIGLEIKLAQPKLIDYAVQDTPIQSTDTVHVRFAITNVGNGLLSSPRCWLSSTIPYIDIPAETLQLMSILPGDTICTDYFTIYVTDAPEICFPDVMINLRDIYGYEFTDTLQLVVGRPGLFDDVESDIGWTHGGANDYWHRSTIRAHSGDHSWYMGVEGSTHYLNNTCSWLLSPIIVLPPAAELRFWYWMDITTYGSDGLYVLVGYDGDWDTLDYIGSGGALDSILDFGVDWVPAHYNLNMYEAGDTLQIKFIFVSDETDVAEGIYIDDIYVGKAVPQPFVRLLSAYPVTGVTGEIVISLINDGNTAIDSVYAKLYTGDTMVQILTDSVFYGRLLPMEYKSQVYTISLNENIPSDHIIPFELTIYGSGGYSQRNSFEMQAGTLVPVGPTTHPIQYEFIPVALGDKLTIYYTAPEMGTLRIRVYDVAGRVVDTWCFNIEHTHARIEVTHTLQSGVYFIEAKLNNMQVTKKLIIF